jgi:glycosyltransferase involved in cell wall biosynthesis
MKVLVLIDAWFPFVGGAQVHIRALKKEMMGLGCKYYLLHSPSANIFIRFLWSLWVIPQAIYLQQKINFDLIHAHAYWSGIPGKILSLILNKPVVFTVHGSNLLDVNSRTPRAFLEKIILTHIKYDFLITVSKHFLQYNNVNKNMIHVPNGVDINSFTKVKTNKAKPFKILFVGRDDPIKGIKYLRKAIKQVKKSIPAARLKIISKEYRRKSLIREYKNSHLFVLPSISEGQPLTLLEAWAAKLPVIVTAVGDNQEMVESGKNGYLVSPKDSKALSQAIKSIYANYDEGQKMGKRGYQLVKSKYSWKVCAQKTYDVYKKLVKA